jgi:hypothetical protein
VPTPGVGVPTLNATYPTTTNSVSIAWTPVTGATSYDYQVGSGPVLSTTSASVTLSGLAIGTTGFKVRAVKTGVSSAWASSSIVYSQSLPDSPVIAASYDTLNGSVTVSWATVPGATSYQYQIGAGSIVTTTSTSVTLSGLPVGSTAFNVRSANGAGTSAPALTTINYAPAAPATPILDAIYGTSTDHVTISWAPVPGATAYEYQVESGAVIRTTSTEVTLSGLALGSTSFALRASGEGGTGWWTTATIVSAPAEQAAPVLSVSSVGSAKKRKVTIAGSAVGTPPADNKVAITLYIKKAGAKKYRAYHYSALVSASGNGFVFTRRIQAPRAGKAYLVVSSAGASTRSRRFTIKR